MQEAYRPWRIKNPICCPIPGGRGGVPHPGYPPLSLPGWWYSIPRQGDTPSLNRGVPHLGILGYHRPILTCPGVGYPLVLTWDQSLGYLPERTWDQWKYYGIEMEMGYPFRVWTDWKLRMQSVKTNANKKVLLRECKRHTTCRVVSTPSVVLTGYPPILTWPGGYPVGGVPCQGVTLPGYPPSWPGRVPPLAGYPPGRVPPRPGLGVITARVRSTTGR